MAPSNFIYGRIDFKFKIKKDFIRPDEIYFSGYVRMRGKDKVEIEKIE
jgi:hypothetical protein